MMRTVVTSGNDALNILFEAATAQDQGDNSNGSTPKRVADPASAKGVTPQNRNYGSPASFEPVPKVKRPVAISGASKETLAVWQACRFVKMGWFTAKEAVTFIDL